MQLAEETESGPLTPPAGKLKSLLIQKSVGFSTSAEEESSVFIPFESFENVKSQIQFLHISFF